MNKSKGQISTMTWDALHDLAALPLNLRAMTSLYGHFTQVSMAYLQFFEYEQ
jgi:hypothetical protein